MTYKLRFLSETEEDVWSGYAWYEGKALGLGEEFKIVFYSCSVDIARNPFVYHKVAGDFRRCLVRKFPFSIYFLVEQDTILVCGFFHCAREPEWIKRQVEERKENE